ncbi:MAG: hypothetical protein LKG11_00865 [Bacilli bacterium]|jgi:hypothetical protein|nr:hypothetical protein [Bacilli bacterium]
MPTKTRRGVSSDIIECDGFISMPASAQALYMHLIVTCDDEGFTTKMSLCKTMAHASDDDEKILLARGFILQLHNEYRVVTIIKHWWANNYMRGDRVKASDFSERELVYLQPNGSYTLDSKKGDRLKALPNPSTN